MLKCRDSCQTVSLASLDGHALTPTFPFDISSLTTVCHRHRPAVMQLG